MNTQRVNCYISGSGLAVFYIQQYNEKLKEWFDLGKTYDKVEHASIIVERHNLQEVHNELLKERERVA